MRLYVIRHAIAVDADAHTPDDARALSDTGRQKFAQTVRGLAALDVRFDLILHSPLLRAVQTAELLTPLLRGTTRVSAHLATPPAPELLAELDSPNTAVVGHEPWLSQLVAWLVTGDATRGAAFALKKGGLAVLEGRPLACGMALVSFLPPSVTRGLAH